MGWKPMPLRFAPFRLVSPRHRDRQGSDRTCKSQSMNADYTRALRLPDPGAETFFLWGPRQSGKTTLLRGRYPDAVWIDLLKADEFRRYGMRPELLREELARSGRRFVVV